MIETVVGAIAAPIFEQLWKLGAGVFVEIKKQNSKVDAINKLLAASKRYEQRYRDRHGQIKVMPGLMKQAVPLESIYSGMQVG